MGLKTVARKLGPAQHGRPIRDEELAASEFVSGFKYEVINGRLYVAYEPDLPENWVEDWLYHKLKTYALARPKIINYVARKARVFVPARRETIPEPDLAAYRDFPSKLPLREMRWQEVSPILVAEIFSGRDPDKDLIRNVGLYLRVPTLREYWIIDICEDPDRPSMIVYRRRGRRWQRAIEVRYGETYTTRLLPGFELLLDPRK